MSTGKSNGTPQGRLRNQAVSGRNTASPLTPRLAANANSVKREPSPRRPFVRGVGTSRDPSPEKNATPVRALAADNVTPRSLGRGKVKAGSTVSTPASTPGSARARTAYTTPRVAALHTPGDKDGRVPPRVNTTDGVHRRDGATLSPLAQDAIMTNMSARLDDVAIKNPSSMFFHADEAKAPEPVEPAPATAPSAKRAAFFYANGQREEQQSPRMIRPNSPALSMIADQRSLAHIVRPAGTSELGLGSNRQRVTSPTLSAISYARSPFVLSPNSISPEPRSASPTKTDYLTTPHATLNHHRLRERSTESAPPRTPMTEGLGVTLGTDLPATSRSSPRSHNKAMSICAMPSESPSAARKRSATWTDNKPDVSPSRSRPSSQYGPSKVQPGSPTAARGGTGSSLTSPIVGEALQSPSRELIDYAADARRERKVLDLEISNSSLLAINRTLEREVKKHKAELKRYRRLSRAGRFSVAPGPLTSGDHDEGDGLPHIDGAFVGRPSSPFEEDVSDMDLSDEDNASDAGSTSSTPLSKEDKQRAKDEAQLRADLRKHRELLLDTARMNRSLQRCLTWTEDLIKDGKKALTHQPKGSDIRLGGRVLDDEDEFGDNLLDSPDDADDASRRQSETEVESAVDDEHAIEGEGEDFNAMEAFIGIGPWQRADRGGSQMSAGSGGTSRDSGVELEKSASSFPPRRTSEGGVGIT